VGIFKRRKDARPAQDRDADLRAAISSVVVLDDDQPGRPAPADAHAQLLRIVSEAVILQDQAVELLAAVRDREPLGVLAPRGGPLARRFFVLRERLPRPVDAEMARQCQTASVLLDHHGMTIHYALEMLAADWRSPAIVDQLERIDGLGSSAERLDALYTELAARSQQAAAPQLAV
jgi:hypothetical protein